MIKVQPDLTSLFVRKVNHLHGCFFISSQIGCTFPHKCGGRESSCRYRLVHSFSLYGAALPRIRFKSSLRTKSRDSEVVLGWPAHIKDCSHVLRREPPRQVRVGGLGPWCRYPSEKSHIGLVSCSQQVPDSPDGSRSASAVKCRRLSTGRDKPAPSPQ